MHSCFWVCLLTHFIQSLRLLPFGFLSLFCMSVCLLFVLAMENFTDLIHIVSANQKIRDHRKWCWKGSEDILLRWTKGDLNLCKQFLPGIVSFWPVLKILYWGDSPADIVRYYSSPSPSSSLEVLSCFFPLHSFKITWCLVPSE